MIPDSGICAGRCELGMGSDVFVAAHAIIRKGVTIGNGAVTGADVLGAESVPGGEIWAGYVVRGIGFADGRRMTGATQIG
jgi:acetyltransferase-like isoleucine patch superfamily enzyme